MKRIMGYIIKVLKSINYNINKYIGSNQYGWFGNYLSWETAISESGKYENEVIIEKVRDACFKVKKGEAVYERDSVIFDKIEYSYPILSSLLWIASVNNNKLNIIDFGGSLGSTYYQNRFFLTHLQEFSWNIVEQDKFVTIGKNEFEDKRLFFYYSIGECIKEKKINALLLSSVIQYIEKPYILLDEIFSYNIEYIVIDLTGFILNNGDRLTVQKVSPSIYNAEYPCWFFNEQNFLNYFYEKYELLLDFDSFLGGRIEIDGRVKAKYRGFLFRLKKRK